MSRYQRNNIIFRIASSTAIGKFKRIQAQSFTQLVRKELNFNDSAREVVLLEYDKMSQWIFKIERICLVVKEGLMPDTLISAINESCSEEIKSIDIMMASYPEIFTKKVLDFVKVIHNYSGGIILDRIEELVNQTVDRAFEHLVDIISIYLQHLLICLHEINNNISGNIPFIGVSEFCLMEENDGNRFSTIAKRIAYFKEIGCGDTYVLKSYVDIDVYNAAKKYLQKMGILLVKEDDAWEYSA